MSEVNTLTQEELASMLREAISSVVGRGVRVSVAKMTLPESYTVEGVCDALSDRYNSAINTLLTRKFAKQLEDDVVDVELAVTSYGAPVVITTSENGGELVVKHKLQITSKAITQDDHEKGLVGAVVSVDAKSSLGQWKGNCKVS